MSAKVLFQQVAAAHIYATSGPQTGLNVTIQDTADVLSRLEVSRWVRVRISVRVYCGVRLGINACIWSTLGLPDSR